MHPRSSPAGKCLSALDTTSRCRLVLMSWLRHAWMSYMVDQPPTTDKIMQSGVRKWETAEHRPNLTLSRAAFKTYSTYVSRSI